MGKRARLKKQLKVERILQQRKQIVQREVANRTPVMRMLKLTLVVLIVTVALLYVGRIVNQRIAKTDSISEAMG